MNAERLAEIRKRDEEMSKSGVRDAFGCGDRHYLLSHIERQEEAIKIARNIADAGALLASNYPHYITELRAALAKLDEAR